MYLQVGTGFLKLKTIQIQKDKQVDKNLFGAAKGKNVILISMESTQSFVINKKNKWKRNYSIFK